MSDAIRIFLNDEPVEASEGTLIRDVIASRDPALADRLDAGTAFVTDGVGRPIPSDRRTSAGAIFRVVRSARRPRDA